MPALLALLSSLLWGTSDFLGGTLSRRLLPRKVIGVSQAIGFAGLLPVAALTGGFGAGTGFLGWSAAAGVVGLVALLAFYRALAMGTMGVVAPVAATGVVIPVVVGLGSGESPHALQLGGLAVAIIGVVVVSGPQRRHGSGSPGASQLRPLALALVAAVGFGSVLVFVARGSESSVVMTLLTMRGVVAALLAVGVFIGRTTRGSLPLAQGTEAVSAEPVRRRDLPLLALIGALDASANGTYAVATRSSLVSVVAVLASLYPAVTVLLGRQVHGERLRRGQLGGVGAVLVGTLLLAAG